MRIIAAILVVAAFGAAQAASAQKPAQNMKRVAEIAAMLPDEPGFPLSRIEHRRMWDRLAELEDAKKAIRQGAEAAAKPVPALDDSTYTNTVREIWGPLSD